MGLFSYRDLITKTFVSGNQVPWNDVIFSGIPLVISIMYLHNAGDTVLYVTLYLNSLLCQTLHTTYILQGLLRTCIFISLVHKSFPCKQLWSKNSGYKLVRPCTTRYFVNTNHANTNSTAIYLIFYCDKILKATTTALFVRPYLRQGHRDKQLSIYFIEKAKFTMIFLRLLFEVVCY